MKGVLEQEGDGGGGGNEPRTYGISFTEKSGMRTCSVEGCSVWVATRMATRVQLWNRHVGENVVILEEGNLPQPQCTLCDMLVSWRSLNG